MNIDLENLTTSTDKIGYKFSADYIAKNKLNFPNIMENQKVLSNTFHNLKNPLGAIIGYTDLLITDANELLDTDKLYYLNQIKKSADITNEYLNKLFEWFNCRMLTEFPKKEKLSIHRVVNEIINNKILPNNNCQFILELSEDHFIYGNEESIRKIFYNIIENAVIYTNYKGIISIRSYEQQKFIDISVRDNGIGMSKELMNNLLDGTKNLKMFKNKIYSGTGLGLLLVKELLRINNGMLSINSNEDFGTEISVKLLRNSVN